MHPSSPVEEKSVFMVLLGMCLLREKKAYIRVRDRGVLKCPVVCDVSFMTAVERRPCVFM